MLQRYTEQSLIGKELDSDKKQMLFNYSKSSFLHNIDTFYYSIKLEEDFRRDSEDGKVKRLRLWKESVSSDSIAEESRSLRHVIPGLED